MYNIWGQDSVSSFGTSDPVLPGVTRLYTFVSMVLTLAGACGGTRVVERGWVCELPNQLGVILRLD